MQAWTDSNYAYVIGTSGLSIYDVSDESVYATCSGNFTSVWANENYVFIGTSSSGVKYLIKPCSSGVYTSLNDLSNLSAYLPTSTNINYVHGNENNLLIVTDSGVDFIKLNPQGYKSSTSISGIDKCFLTSGNKIYYMSNSTLYVVYTCLFDWVVADKEYTTNSGIFSGVNFNDIYVTPNTIFAATNNGVYVVDEISEEYDVYYNI